MKYISVCSGIDSPTVAWHPLGWKPQAFSEIEKFPSAVLAHHWPEVPNLGDMTQHHGWPFIRPDLIVGGTPCQAFSVSGLRKGLADPRGNLTLTFLSIIAQYRPTWVVWENVPGVLSDNTNAFGCFLAGLSELGYGWAYRVLNAQYYGVPQRRRRVFVVGHIGNWGRAAAVLFERHCMQGHSPPRQEAREGITGTLGARTTAGGGLGTDFDLSGGVIASTVTSKWSKWSKGSGGPAGDECHNLIAHSLRAQPHSAHDHTLETYVTHALRGEGFDASEDGTGRGTPLIPIAFDCKASGRNGFGVGDISPTLRAMASTKSHQNAGGQVAIAFAENSRAEIRLDGGDGQSVGTLSTGGGKPGQGTPTIITPSLAVRRLTPLECERLQGFPDNHTRIPYGRKSADQCPDGPRYKVIGNSMAVPVMRWIGQRIEMISKMEGRAA